MDDEVGRDQELHRDPETGVSKERLTELRRILLGQETSAIQEIQETLQDRDEQTERLSQLLPRAIRLRSKQDDRLAAALDPTVSKILEKSVRRNPKALARILFPVIGPAIRASLASTLREMLAAFERTLNHSLSPKSIGWRLEAYRTQRPFSEIVLLHSIQFQVEQIFLVHGESGVLLQHAVAENSPSDSADIISAMLTAIQDFVKDSFAVSPEAGLNSLEVGELSVWIERGPGAIVAAVIRGNAPASTRHQLRQVIETIHQEETASLEEFAGDTGPFEVYEPDLRACLQSQLRETEAKSGVSWVWGVVALLLVAALGYWVYSRWQDSAQLERLTQSLQAEPGIIVTRSEKQGGRFLIEGLRDPLSVDPARLAQQFGIDSERIRAFWEPYHAISPVMVKRRAERILQPPEGVALEVEGDLLRATGRAASSWMRSADRLVRSVPGISTWDRSQVSDPEERRILESIEQASLQFLGQDQPAPDEAVALDQLRTALQELQDLAQANLWTIRLYITGVTDESGSDSLNRQVGLSRARFVQRQLRATGLPEALLEWHLQQRRGAKRAVELRAELVKPDF